MTLRRAPFATFVHRLIEDHEGSGPQRVCILCAIVSVLTFVQLTHCVDYRVLASLDGTTQCLKLDQTLRPADPSWDSSVPSRARGLTHCVLLWRFYLRLSLSYEGTIAFMMTCHHLVLVSVPFHCTGGCFAPPSPLMPSGWLPRRRLARCALSRAFGKLS